MNKEICKNCEYYYTDELKDGYCCNDKSEHCTNYVERDFSCSCWEKKEDKAMREILFRGKSRGAGGWKYGYLNQHRGNTTYDVYGEPINGSDFYICDWAEKIDSGLYGVDYKVIPETVGQYAGLQDKKGKKIFEGDIVSDADGKLFVVQANLPYGFTFKNISDCFCMGVWDMGVSEDNTRLISASVIGNIHDNPELLEEKKSAKEKSNTGSIEQVIQAQFAKKELKSKKAQVLFKPSTYEGLKEAAADMGTSVNNLLNVLAEEFLKSR